MRLLTSLALITANLIPLYGVLFLGWSVGQIIILYWLENIVIGLYTWLRMTYKINRYQSDEKITQGKFNRSFFLMHYGMFTIGHGIFLLVFFFNEIKFTGAVLLGMCGLLASHGASYIGNFIIKKEHSRATPSNLFLSPYPRIIVMHVTILIGAILMMNYGSSVAALLVLIGTKTLIDVVMHWFKHAT